MGFKTDGSSHASGILNEANFIERIEGTHGLKCFPSLTGYKYTVEPKGGTKHKADCTILYANRAIDVSNKKKEKLKTGSFDWINTSSYVKENQRSLQPAYNTYLYYKMSHKPKEEARLALKKSCNRTLRNLSSLDLKGLLRSQVIEKNKNIQVVVTDLQTRTDYVFPFSSHPINKVINTYNLSLDLPKTSTTQESARILFNRGSDQLDLGLRIRLCTNNGITKLINGGGCSLVIKIQQDKCDKLIEEVKKTGTLKVIKF